MKVVWGKFGTGVDLIVCAISSYWWVSLWVNEKDAFHAYSSVSYTHLTLPTIA